jgi:methylmalonyl-CoA/ethylmalonyl-CoA epimerase
MLPNLKFHHIGVATYSIECTAQHYIDAGYALSNTVYDPIQNVSIAFLEKKGEPLIELVAAPPPPNHDNSPVNKIIEKTGVSPYHICYEADNIAAVTNELKKKKYMPLARPVNAVALNNRKILFLYNKEIGLIELVERSV